MVFGRSSKIEPAAPAPAESAAEAPAPAVSAAEAPAPAVSGAEAPAPAVSAAEAPAFYEAKRQTALAPPPALEAGQPGHAPSKRCRNGLLGGRTTYRSRRSDQHVVTRWTRSVFPLTPYLGREMAISLKRPYRL